MLGKMTSMDRHDPRFRRWQIDKKAWKDAEAAKSSFVKDLAHTTDIPLASTSFGDVIGGPVLALHPERLRGSTRPPRAGLCATRAVRKRRLRVDAPPGLSMCFLILLSRRRLQGHSNQGSCPRACQTAVELRARGNSTRGSTCVAFSYTQKHHQGSCELQTHRDVVRRILRRRQCTRPREGVGRSMCRAACAQISSPPHARNSSDQQH